MNHTPSLFNEYRPTLVSLSKSQRARFFRLYKKYLAESNVHGKSRRHCFVWAINEVMGDLKK